MGSRGQKSSLIRKNNIVDKWNNHFRDKYGSYDVLEGNIKTDKLKDGWISIDDNVKEIQSELLNEQFRQFDKLYEEYQLQDTAMRFVAKDSKDFIANTNGSVTELSSVYFKDPNSIIERLRDGIKNNYYTKVYDRNISKYPITHEFGHMLEVRYFKQNDILTTQDKDYADEYIKQTIFKNVASKTGLTYKQIEKRYIKDMPKESGREHREWFAEAFTQYHLGKKNIFNKEVHDWIKENIK